MLLLCFRPWGLFHAFHTVHEAWLKLISAHLFPFFQGCCRCFIHSGAVSIDARVGRLTVYIYIYVCWVCPVPVTVSKQLSHIITRFDWY